MTERPPLPPLRDDGLPTLPTGEPVLHRWFVIAMLVLVPIAVVVSVWAALTVWGERDQLPAAERRPPGDEVTTVDRGSALLPEVDETEAGPGCAEQIEIVGDRTARAAGRRALGATCALLRTGRFPAADAGLESWAAADGWLTLATFELTGVESSAGLQEERLVVELNAKFQFEDATRAAPAVIHQLTLLAEPDFPGTPISAEAQLRAAEAQAVACERLTFADVPPRGCLDVAELLAEDDPVAALVEAGYESRG